MFEGWERITDNDRHWILNVPKTGTNDIRLSVEAQGNRGGQYEIIVRRGYLVLSTLMNVQEKYAEDRAIEELCAVFMKLPAPKIIENIFEKSQVFTAKKIGTTQGAISRYTKGAGVKGGSDMSKRTKIGTLRMLGFIYDPQKGKFRIAGPEDNIPRRFQLLEERR